MGTCRRELLAQVIVFNEGHLRRLLRELLAYDHDDRTHLSLDLCRLVATTALQVEALPEVCLPANTGKGSTYMRLMGNAVAAGASVIAASMLVLATPCAFANWWTPPGFAKERTLKLRTKCRDEGERWLRERFVVVDGMLYVRLSRGEASRVQCNGTSPLLGVEVAGQRFERVRGVPAAVFAKRVDKAMADKYITDIVVRLIAHPLTLRLVPEW